MLTIERVYKRDGLWWVVHSRGSTWFDTPEQCGEWLARYLVERPDVDVDKWDFETVYNNASACIYAWLRSCGDDGDQALQARVAKSGKTFAELLGMEEKLDHPFTVGSKWLWVKTPIVVTAVMDDTFVTFREIENGRPLGICASDLSAYLGRGLLKPYTEPGEEKNARLRLKAMIQRNNRRKASQQEGNHGARGGKASPPCPRHGEVTKHIGEIKYPIDRERHCHYNAEYSKLFKDKAERTQRESWEQRQISAHMRTLTTVPTCTREDKTLPLELRVDGENLIWFCERCDDA